MAEEKTIQVVKHKHRHSNSLQFNVIRPNEFLMTLIIAQVNYSRNYITSWIPDLMKEGTMVNNPLPLRRWHQTSGIRIINGNSPNNFSL